jgi:ankyrin repeat protein
MNKVANKFQEQIAHKVQQGTSMIKYLVEQGADVNARDWYKATPLHLACRRGSRRIVRELLECPGIDPHVTESFSLNNPIEFD